MREKTPVPSNAGRKIQSCVKDIKLYQLGSKFIKNIYKKS